MHHVLLRFISKQIQKGGKGHEDGSTAIISKDEPLLTGEEDEPENNQVIIQKRIN